MSYRVQEIKDLVVLYTKLHTEAKENGWEEQRRQCKKLRNAARLIAEDHDITWKKL